MRIVTPDINLILDVNKRDKCYHHCLASTSIAQRSEIANAEDPDLLV